MEISSAGIAMIVSFEGKGSKEGRLPNGDYKPYLDKLATKHIWTLYTGLTHNVDPNRTYTEAECKDMFHKELAVFENDVRTAIHVPLNQNEFDALVSFAYNCGSGALRKSIAPLINAGKRSAVPAKMAEYRNAGGKPLAGLIRRRKAEGALFMAPVTEPHVEEDDHVMPQAPEQAVTPVTQAIGKAAAESKSFWASLSGLIAAAWSWATGTASQVGTEATAAKESLSAWDALWSFIGVNSGTIMAAIIIASLVVVLARSVSRSR